MTFYDELIFATPKLAVKELVVGVFNTFVSSEKTGICSTLVSQINDNDLNRGLLDLSSISLNDLAKGVLSINLIEATIGVAAINAAVQPDHNLLKEINAEQIITEEAKGKTVGVIGHFPFIDRLKNNCKKLYVFEKQPIEDDLTEDQIPNYLPEADVVAITGSTITNHSFQNVMASVRSDAFVIILGGSTPLSPVFFNYGVDVVSGVFVADPALVQQQIKLGVHTRKLQGLERVSLFKKDR